MTEIVNDTLMPNYTFRFSSPDGMVITVITDEEHPNVQILIGKNGSSIASWAQALSSMMTFALESRTIEEVADLFGDITTDKAVFTKALTTCRSSPEAISFALLEFSRIRKKKAMLREEAEKLKAAS